MTTGNTLTVMEALRVGIQALGNASLQLPAPRLCEILLSDLLQCRPLDLLATPSRQLDASTAATFDNAIRRLAAGEPLQYITGTTFFMERSFRCDRRALIPRPETETLIRAVRECMRRTPPATPPRFLDAGTGSGCLAVTLALEWPAADCLASDCQADALTLAMENAQRHGVADRIQFIHAAGIPDCPDSAPDVIVTNPPYIPTADYNRLPRYIRDHEPRSALDGGPDGLTVIDVFIRQARQRIRSGGWLVIEIGDGQAAEVVRRLAAAGFTGPTPQRDIAGQERVVYAQAP